MAAVNVDRKLAEVAQIFTDPRPSRECYRNSDLGNAERIIDEHGEDLRHVSELGWLTWDGKRWAEDRTGEVYRRAEATIRGILEDATRETDSDRRRSLAKWALASESDSRIKAAVNRAVNQLEVVARVEDFDRDDWLLTVENGTLDLRTGKLGPHRREHRITQLAPVEFDPEAKAPTWERFIGDITAGEADLQRFLRVAAGYTLTGSTREQILLILWGTGSNGKSTYLRTLGRLLGDYARNTSTETLLVKRDAGIPNDVARLRGARLVVAQESEDGRRLAESLVKQLTGGDTVSARFLHREFFEFEPRFKLYLGTNHKPRIRGTDLAIWRRIRLVPFIRRFEGDERDRDLADKLAAELPGILNWALTGCREWLESGLPEVDAVSRATEDYRREEDVLGEFVEECCVVGETCETRAAGLYRAYVSWAEDSGERPVTQTSFGTRLTERGFESARITQGAGKGRKVWLGIGLRQESSSE